ncbi:MAG: LysR family transcriptional regulator [Amylibacter sp.]|nr:LysR family transcriptional regulator [Amylibacter sp.]
MDQLRALRYFSKLAQTLSFSETADYFRVPSSSVSRRIKDLEENLGIELFLRTTRSVSLTDLGVLYLAEIKTALQTIEIADEMCKAQSISPSGTVRITAMPAYAELYVLPAINKMRKLYPDLEFDLNITDQTLSLSSNDADIAIRATSDLPEQVVARRLSKHNFILVASPDFLNQNGKPQTSDDLNRFPVFMYRTPHGVLNWQAQKNQTWKDVELTPKYVSNHGQSLLDSVVGGQGIALLPSWGVANEISTGQLQEIELKDGMLSTSGDLEMNMYLLYHPPKFQLKKIKLTVDFLYKELNLLRKITT